MDHGSCVQIVQIGMCMAFDELYKHVDTSQTAPRQAYFFLPWYPSVWLVLPVETLHAATFACAWSAGLWKSKMLAPPGTEARVLQTDKCIMYKRHATAYNRQRRKPFFRACTWALDMAWGV